MKKLLAFTLALAMALTLFACSKAADPVSSSEPVTDTQDDAEPAFTFEDIRVYDKYLPTSLGIEMKNVNLTAVRDDRPLEDYELQLAARYGVTGEAAKAMTRAELLDLESKHKLTPQSISSIKTVYPEVPESVLRTWTYGDYEAYGVAVSYERLRPSEEIRAELERRGITEDDFMRLRKFYEYESDEEIIARSDDELRATIIKDYEQKLEYARAVSKDDYGD
ncbi:MAG: hypothetical protein J5441_02180 [Clostridia bacterium]|nr:hypothetical protein [Clostridia bacterium]